MTDIKPEKICMCDWNHMDSAPKATPILLAFPEHDTGKVVVREGFKWDIVNAPVFYSEDYGSVNPTHWQALPAPPEA